MLSNSTANTLLATGEVQWLQKFILLLTSGVELVPNEEAHVSKTSWGILLSPILVSSTFGTKILVTSKQALRTSKEIGIF